MLGNWGPRRCPSSGKPHLAGSPMLTNQTLLRRKLTSAKSQRSHEKEGCLPLQMVLLRQLTPTLSKVVLVVQHWRQKKNYTAAESEVLQSSRHSPGVQQPLPAVTHGLGKVLGLAWAPRREVTPGVVPGMLGNFISTCHA